MAQVDRDTQEKIDDVLSRVQNIDFFQSRNLEKANSLIPEIEKTLTKYPFPNWLDSNSSFNLPKAIAYKNKTYQKVRNGVRTSIKLIKKKINPKIDGFLEEAYTGGFWFWFHCRRYILKEVSRHVALCIWYEAMDNPNPLESCIRLYELGLRPRGFKQVFELKVRESSTEPEPMEVMLRPGEVTIKPSYYSQSCNMKPVIDIPLTGTDVISPVRFYDGNMTFTTPSSLDRSCLGCYVQGDEEIRYVHYWTEDCSRNLRPLGMENVISYFEEDPRPEDDFHPYSIINITRREIRNVTKDLLFDSTHYVSSQAN